MFKKHTDGSSKEDLWDSQKERQTNSLVDRRSQKGSNNEEEIIDGMYNRSNIIYTWTKQKTTNQSETSSKRNKN